MQYKIKHIVINYSPMKTIRKISGYILLIMVMLVTIMAILGIWDVIDLQHILSKTLASLLVIFASSAVVLFIFTIIINFRDHSSSEGMDNK